MLGDGNAGANKCVHKNCYNEPGFGAPRGREIEVIRRMQLYQSYTEWTSSPTSDLISIMFDS